MFIPCICYNNNRAEHFPVTTNPSISGGGKRWPTGTLPIFFCTEAQGALSVDLQQLILDEIKSTRADLKAHIKDEDEKFNEVRKDISDLKTQAQLVNQRSKFINGAIATIVAGIVTWFANMFGMRG